VVLRRLLVIALLALVSVAGVAATSAMANAGASAAVAVEASPALRLASAEAAVSTPAADETAAALPFHSDDHGDPATSAGHGVPCVQQASCAGGALLAGATLLLFLPAAGLALPTPTPAAPVAAMPAQLRSALLASKLFRPPRAS
jgi:hypothetical protein